MVFSGWFSVVGGQLLVSSGWCSMVGDQWLGINCYFVVVGVLLLGFSGWCLVVYFLNVSLSLFSVYAPTGLSLLIDHIFV
jgi:hypothetical protein